MSTPPRRIGPATWLVREEPWLTTSVLAVSAAEAVVCGPGFTTDAVAAVAQPARVHLLVTHLDFDHLQGAARLPEAEVITDARTAASLADPDVDRRYAALAAEWATPWRAVEVDRVVDGPFTCGSVPVEPLPTPGHTDGGLAFLLPEQNLLLLGDNASPVTPPLITGTVRDARATCRRLLAAVARPEVQLVVPGHGAAMDPLAAEALLAEDLAYLDALAEAAAEAGGEPPGPALLHLLEVPLPRAALGGFASIDIRGTNARAALAEV